VCSFFQALENAGYHALSVSVLTFNFINEDKLADALRQAHTFSGIVLTSPRSAQAVIKAATTLNSGKLITGSFPRYCL
jgi:uroporphyrinogen-III synthase